MLLIRFYIVIILLFTLVLNSISQEFDDHLFSEIKISDSDTNKVFFNIDNNNYIRNNEYFGKVAEGYTLLGFNIAPKITYSPNEKIKLTAGANLLSYYSRSDETKVEILLSFQYKLLPKLDFILGNIYGTVNHKLIDPLYDFERFFTNNTENGVQFLWNGSRLKADLWLDWEQQIFYNDPFQEKFNVGLSSNLILYKDDNINLSIPFQNLIRHEGGQINSNRSATLTTIYTNALGLSFDQKINWKYLHKYKLSSYWVNYQDLSPTKKQLFIDGDGSYSTLELFNKHFDALLGYWYGHQFISPTGNPLYESRSRENIFIEEPYRSVVVGKLSYQNAIYKGINLGFRFDSYYDTHDSNLEYSWSIMVVINEKFSLGKF